MKRARNGVDKPVVHVWQREVGHLSTRSFARRFGASENLVLRLAMHRKLEKHQGCVNTVSFNGDGDILVSGSDDTKVILWNWESGKEKLSFDSGHGGNVFQAKIMPFSDDRSIVTSSADGQVRHAQILERGKVETSQLAEHQGRAHKLANEPGSPHIFYSCAEDGVVNHFDLRSGAATSLFTCYGTSDKRKYGPIIPLNSITIDPRNPNLFAVAGSDKYTRLYDIRNYKWDGSSSFGRPADYFCPPDLIGDDLIGITGLAYSEQSELLVSYSDEFIYLFTRGMGLGPNLSSSSYYKGSGDSEKRSGCCSSGASSSAMDFDHCDDDDDKVPQVYKGHLNSDTVKGVNFFGPKCEYVVSGSDCGRIFIWRKKGGELIRVIEADTTVVNCIEPHPHTPVLASSGIEDNVKIWTPKLIERAELPTTIERGRQFHPGLDWYRRDNPFFNGDDDDDDEDDEDDDDSDNCDDEDSDDYTDDDDDGIDDDDEYDDVEDVDDDEDEASDIVGDCDDDYNNHNDSTKGL